MDSRALRSGCVLAAACALAVIARAASAQAAPAAKRRVAVLEFRSGSAALDQIGQRMAQLLRDRTSLDIVDQTEARNTFGAGLDKAVVDCAGAPACIARVGKKLGVDEVLLVGVAEFGDVILTLQRIAVADGRVRSRVAEALAPRAPADAAALDGFVRRVMPRSDFVRYGVLRIRANVSGAQVKIGGKQRGKTPLAPLRVLAPATYRIEVTKSGYIDFRAAVAVPPDAEVQVRPILTQRDDAWYKKWWVLAIVGTVAAGAVTTAVVVSRETTDDVPVTGDF